MIDDANRICVICSAPITGGPKKIYCSGTCLRTTRKEYQKQYIEDNKEKLKARSVQYHLDHREQICARVRKYVRDNKESVSRKKSIYQANRRKNDPVFALIGRLRARIRAAIRMQATEKAKKSMALLGCSVPEFMAHLQSKFTSGMSWELLHRGEIEIDHILPCSLFDLSKPEQQARCFHFSNHQPLWKQDNRNKSNRIFNSPELLSL